MKNGTEKQSRGPKRLLVVTTLDTKGTEAAFVKAAVERLGVVPLVMDVGTLEAPAIAPDISRDEIARAAGRDLADAAARRDRTSAIEIAQIGGAAVAQKLCARGEIDGVLGLGGGTGTAIASYIMRSLPFGLPKVLLSTVASRDIRQYIETKDICIIHTVADLLGFNRFIRRLLGQSVRAVCAMMEEDGEETRKPMVAVTAYGVSSACAVNAQPLLLSLGYEMIGFHANGCGGMAMEELIEEGGRIEGVLEFTPHELADEMFGGYCRGIGPKRFETAGIRGVPMVFAPGGLDNAVFSPHYPMPDSLAGRRTHGHDERFCVRMEAEEMMAFADIIGEKLNRAGGPVHVLIPLKGWSEADKPGMNLYDPGADAVFVKRLKEILNPRIPLEEMDVHISDPPFARRAVDILHSMMEERKAP